MSKNIDTVALRENIKTWIKKHGCCHTSLIHVLHETQDEYGYVLPEAMEIIADELDIHPVEVDSVCTFYHFFHTEPKGKKIIRLCQTISCEFQGKNELAKALEKKLGIKFGETTKDGEYTLEYTNCMGMCDQGPAVMVNKKVFGKMTAEKIEDIL